MNVEVTENDVYESFEYQQYLLILDEYAAFQYAREEIVAARVRAASSEPTPIPIRPEYRDYLLTQEWRDRAASAKARFGGRCALCNSDRGLEAHHRTYDRLGHELPEDLTALCSDCHGAYHRWRRGGDCQVLSPPVSQPPIA